MRRCIECDEPIDALEQAHAAHEPDCFIEPGCEDWSCRCDAYAHKRCCQACKPPIEVPGQVSLLDEVPMASTKGLPKKHSGG